TRRFHTASCASYSPARNPTRGSGEGACAETAAAGAGVAGAGPPCAHADATSAQVRSSGNDRRTPERWSPERRPLSMDVMQGSREELAIALGRTEADLTAGLFSPEPLVCCAGAPRARRDAHLPDYSWERATSSFMSAVR